MKWRHPDPYRPPTAPGGKISRSFTCIVYSHILTRLIGSKYERNLPSPILDRKSNHHAIVLKVHLTYNIISPTTYGFVGILESFGNRIDTRNLYIAREHSRRLRWPFRSKSETTTYIEVKESFKSLPSHHWQTTPPIDVCKWDVILWFEHFCQFRWQICIKPW